MKLEIDFGNRQKLEAKRAMLHAMLAAVDAALANMPPEALEVDFGESEITPSLAARVEASIREMADRFKSSDVYNNLPEIPRSVIKDTFRKLVDAGWLKIYEQGQGSRPTIYDKTAKYQI